MFDVNYDIELIVDIIKIDRTKEINKIEIEIEELEKNVIVNVPGNIKSGDQLRLKGLGYKKEDGSCGDVYILFNNVQEINNVLQRKYKYKYVEKISDYELEEKLNEYGEEGWKCISVQSIIENIKPSLFSRDNSEYEPSYEYSLIFEKENLD